jgi:hypothetical protein
MEWEKHEPKHPKKTIKRCIHCGLEVVMDEAEKHFPKSKLTKDGFEGGCKKCKAQKAKERRHAKNAKSKKNPKKAAAASPEKTVEKVVKRAEKVDTIKKNNHDVDWDQARRELDELDSAASMITETRARAEMGGEVDVTVPVLDEMIRQLFKCSGYPDLYEALGKVAFAEMRPVSLQALYMLRGQLQGQAAGKGE